VKRMRWWWRRRLRRWRLRRWRGVGGGGGGGGGGGDGGSVVVAVVLRGDPPPSQAAAFKGHTREVSSLAWHPIHPELFVSGCHAGAVRLHPRPHPHALPLPLPLPHPQVHFWSTLRPSEPLASSFGFAFGKPAHDSAVWGVEWHPLGHILATVSQDMYTKFW
jgi:WD40 repeat protein